VVVLPQGDRPRVRPLFTATRGMSYSLRGNDLRRNLEHDTRRKFVVGCVFFINLPSTSSPERKGRPANAPGSPLVSPLWCGACPDLHEPERPDVRPPAPVARCAPGPGGPRAWADGRATAGRQRAARW
jgi:hypothetical protein